MRVVWSFWTKPFYSDRKSIWAAEEHHLYSWILSFYTAREHFDETALYTDDEGARMLVDGLGLEFDHVSNALNTLKESDPKWWALGKIYAYRFQEAPFLHIDSDVFLWDRPRLNFQSPLFAQNPEVFGVDTFFYMPEELEKAAREVPDAWLPSEWKWYRSSRLYQRAESCGIFGGTRIDFINYYADLAIRFIEHPSNQKVWRSLDRQVERNILAEQYLLSACIEYHKCLADSPFQGLGIEYLFNTCADAFNPKKAVEVGYTHLIAGAKKNRDIGTKLEKRVKKDYPEAYERCMKCFR